MYQHSALFALIMLLDTLGSTLGQNDCGGCFRLDSGTIAGIVICDVIITTLIALTAYYVSNTIIKRKQEERNKHQKQEVQQSEPTYEELQGQRLDVYNDLNQSRH